MDGSGKGVYFSSMVAKNSLRVCMLNFQRGSPFKKHVGHHGIMFIIRNSMPVHNELKFCSHTKNRLIWPAKVAPFLNASSNQPGKVRQ